MNTQNQNPMKQFKFLSGGNEEIERLKNLCNIVRCLRKIWFSAIYKRGYDPTLSAQVITILYFVGQKAKKDILILPVYIKLWT